MNSFWLRSASHEVDDVVLERDRNEAEVKADEMWGVLFTACLC